MTLEDADIKTYYTQGNAGGSDGSAAQGDPDGSLGGYRSSTEFTDDTEENLCDIFSLAEAVAGGTFYRCLAIRNTDDAEDLLNARIVFDSLPSSGDITIEMGTEAPGDGVTAAAVAADEETPPGGVVFVAATGKTTYADGYGINGGADMDLDFGDNVYLWFKITLSADCERVNTALANGTIEFRVDGVS